jgi:2'-5' RNA ligase
MAESAFIVRVPEAELRFGALRARFDPSAAQGVPAHVTILVPFMPAHWIDRRVLARAAEAWAGVPPFDVVFERVGRWPETAWLAPEPAAPFAALTRALVERFPAYPPYGGQHAGIVPHLTLADGSADAAAQAQDAAEALLRQGGPLRARCGAIDLIENSLGIWRTMGAFALGAPLPPTAESE